MNGARHQLLARAVVAGDEHRRVRTLDAVEHAEELTHQRAAPYDARVRDRLLRDEIRLLRRFRDCARGRVEGDANGTGYFGGAASFPFSLDVESEDGSVAEGDLGVALSHVGGRR